jgi:2-keto-3-deoxy-L-rhamnonate aldolase RhmA
MNQQGEDPFKTADGKPRILRGVAINSGSTRLAEMAAAMGFETVWIEMEHGPTDFERAEALCQAVEAAGGVATIRVSDGQRCHVLRALEVGARIVVVPMVSDAAQARQVVVFGKFPPLGSRGYTTRSRGLRYGLGPTRASFAEANARTHLFVQIETVEAVANLEAICDVEGIAGILIGPGDLSVNLGCPGELADARLVQVVCECVRKARTRGRHAGIFVGPGPLLDAAIAAGCDLCFFGGDIADLQQPWQRLLERVKTGGKEGS